MQNEIMTHEKYILFFPTAVSGVKNESTFKVESIMRIYIEALTGIPTCPGLPSLIVSEKIKKDEKI